MSGGQRFTASARYGWRMSDDVDLEPCPRCGDLKPAAPKGLLETPTGRTLLPTLGMVRKAAAGDAEHGTCECGKRRLDDLDGPAGG